MDERAEQAGSSAAGPTAGNGSGARRPSTLPRWLRFRLIGAGVAALIAVPTVLSQQHRTTPRNPGSSTSVTTSGVRVGDCIEVSASDRSVRPVPCDGAHVGRVTAEVPLRDVAGLDDVLGREQALQDLGRASCPTSGYVVRYTSIGAITQGTPIALYCVSITGEVPPAPAGQNSCPGGMPLLDAGGRPVCVPPPSESARTPGG